MIGKRRYFDGRLWTITGATRHEVELRDSNGRTIVRSLAWVRLWTAPELVVRVAA